MILDKFLPTYEFNEIHTVKVNAPPERVFTAMKELTAAELSPLHLLDDGPPQPARQTDGQNLPQRGSASPSLFLTRCTRADSFRSPKRPTAKLSSG